MTPRFRAVSLMLALAAASSLAEDALPKHYLRAREVTRGMKGYGLSVFQGTKPERFAVEVIGILRNRMPKQDMILIRMDGAVVNKTGVIAGMSGSPIYLQVGDEHKLAGAVAYGWSFPKEPVCGVTPIENMYAVSQSKLAEGTPVAATRKDGLDAPIVLGERRVTDVRVASAPTGWEGMTSHAATVYRLRTPLYISGMTEPALQMARETFEPLGFLPVQGAGGGQSDAPKLTRFVPGASIVAVLAEGDIAMSGGGTVTDVLGDTVLAFGHPMFGEGRVSVPIATSSVELSFASVMRSFKMTSPIATVGRLTADAQAAVVGKMGEQARMIPVTARLRRADMEEDEAFALRIIDHPNLTPRIVGMALANCVVLRGGFPPENTVAFRATVDLKGYKPLIYENVYTGLNSTAAISQAFGDIVKPLATLMDNPLGKVQVQRVAAEFEIQARETTAGIDSVRLDRNEYRPGDTMRAFVTLRTYKDENVVQTLELALPDDFPPGLHTLTLCDAATSAALDRAEAPHRFKARTLDQLIEVLRRQEPRQRLFARIKLPDRGVTREGIELPSLPSSMLNVIASQKVTGLALTGKSLVAHADTAYVVSGKHELKVLVRPLEID